ncbi:MAG: helix-turn-helix transcriptional regulator [Gammaproteobacteria bacterium]|nr:helix-turn-helix transcriptional regulator [Gammaproteobacteria bacterium]
MNKVVTKGNVFADLGYSREEAAVRAMRVELAAEIESFVERKGFTQTQAAKFFGVTQPKISKILRGRIEEFTIDYLVRIASMAGRNPRVAFSTKGRKEATAPRSAG